MRVRNYVDPRDVLLLTGAPLLLMGLAMIYLPLAFLVPGLALTGFSLWASYPRIVRRQ